jgi:hypothetical protein
MRGLKRFMTNSVKKDHTGTRSFLNNLTDSQRQKWAKLQVNRMMQAWQVEDHSGLAAKFGAHERTPSNWIQNRAVPWTAIYTCHEQTGRTLDWLYNGKEADKVISVSQRRAFEKSVSNVLHSAEQMGMVHVAGDIGYKMVVQGLVECLVDIITPDK